MCVLIETERLHMRHFNLADAEDVFQFGSNKEVTRYTSDANDITSLEDARKVIESVWLHEYEKYGYARYALVLKETCKVIGFCGFKYLEEYKLPDLGYRILPKYWGKGLGMEAAKAALDYGQQSLGLNTIIAFAALENMGSTKILEKLNFQNVGRADLDGMPCYRFEKKC